MLMENSFIIIMCKYVYFYTEGYSLHIVICSVGGHICL